jgi:hypothetical protein
MQSHFSKQYNLLIVFNLLFWLFKITMHEIVIIGEIFQWFFASFIRILLQGSTCMHHAWRDSQCNGHGANFVSFFKNMKLEIISVKCRGNTTLYFFINFKCEEMQLYKKILLGHAHYLVFRTVKGPFPPQRINQTISIGILCGKTTL